MTPAAWPAIEDETLVERLIPAIQKAVADVCMEAGGVAEGEWIPVGVADLSNVLLMLLATVVEPLPACATSRGARLFAEAAGKELAALIRDTRRLKDAERSAPATVQ